MKIAGFIRLKGLHIAWLSFALGLLIYVILRALRLSFTHDEAVSYTIITGLPYYVETANNHLLNTLLMDWSSNVFGTGEFALRLPNVMAFGLYLYGCFRILKSFKSSIVPVLGSAILLMNPYLIEFFSLARGYGLSMGFMMLSLMVLIKTDFYNINSEEVVTRLIPTLTFTALALFSNLTTVNYYIAVLAVFAIGKLYAVKTRGSTLKDNIVFFAAILIGLIPLYFGIKRLLLLDSLEQLYFGAPHFTDIAGSLLATTLYDTQYPAFIDIWLIDGLLKKAAMLALPAAAVLIVYKRDYRSKFALITLLNILVLIGFVIEHHLFKAKYPGGRSVLFLIPLFGVFICFFVVRSFEYFKVTKNIKVILISLIALPLIYHFLININLAGTVTWEYDTHTEEAVNKMMEHARETKSGKASVSSHWVFEPAVNYYIDSRELNLHKTDREGIREDADYIYTFGDDADREHFDVLIEYPHINTVLLYNTESAAADGL